MPEQEVLRQPGGAVIADRNGSILDWTRLTRDPTDPRVVKAVTDYLLGIRVPIPHNNYDAYLAAEVAGKRVLDIGVCAHTLDRMNSENWLHEKIRRAARAATGVDILEDLVQVCNERGYDVRLVDATSDVDLGDRFDVVHMGDVIEHVESPLRLLAFGRRHLAAGGKIIVRTPNPFCFDYVHVVGRDGTDVSNLEHLCYVTPTHALEMGRRAGLGLSRYLTLARRGMSVAGLAVTLQFLLSGHWRHAWAEMTAPPERYSTIFVYEFSSCEGAEGPSGSR